MKPTLVLQGTRCTPVAPECPMQVVRALPTCVALLDLAEPAPALDSVIPIARPAASYCGCRSFTARGRIC